MLTLRKNLVKPEPRALYVQMDITTKCNLRCIMCAREQNRPQDKDMSVESFEAIAHKVFDKAAVLNLSCGAEPLMSRYFEEILEIAKRYQVPRVEFVTNGILLNERRIRKIIECGVTAIEVSMDGARKETYERIRRGARFDQLIANLKLLNALKAEYQTKRPHVRLNFVLMRSNIGELPAFIEIAQSLDASEVVPQHLVVFEKAGLADESLFHFQKMSDAFLIQAQRVARRCGILFRPFSLFQETRSKTRQLYDSLPYGIGTLRTYGLSQLTTFGSKIWRRKFVARNIACPLPWEYVLITPGGLVLPCGVWYGEAPMGDINRQAFDEIWWGDSYQRLREELSGKHPLRNVCVNCPSVISHKMDRSAFQPVTT